MTESSWYVVERIADGVTVIREPLHVEDVKSYLIEGDRDVAVIDTGLGVGDFAELVATLSDREPLVLQTHGHWDHIGDSARFARVLVHPSEAYALRRGFPNAMYRHIFSPDFIASGVLPPDFDPGAAAIPGCEPTGELNHGDRVDLGGRVLEVFHTPGHSPGGLTFLNREARLLFPGDAVNYGQMWLYLPRSDAAAYRQTIRLLADLSREVDAVYPAHGSVPLDPAIVPAIRDAFEEVWAGRPPDRHEQRDIGFPEPVPTDVFDFGRFGFLLAAGRYGAQAQDAAAGG